MSDTAVSICSNASLMLGQGAIASLEPPDATQQASLAANLYPSIRNAILRSHTWNCTIKRVILPPTETPPAFDWAYAFNFPDDWIRTTQVGLKDCPVDYDIEGRQFLCNDSVFYLVYQFLNIVEATYDPMLVEVLTLAMKAALAYPMTKSQSVADSAKTELKEKMRQARNVDGQDVPPQTFGDFRLLSVGLESSRG